MLTETTPTGREVHGDAELVSCGGPVYPSFVR